MNKKELILSEAKRLFGNYGYLGFTLKQLAQACDMTAPALYYFYSCKADLFKDCLISELELRGRGLLEMGRQHQHLTEFTAELARMAFAQCAASHFKVGQAMQDVIHLQPHLQAELREAWDKLLISPVEEFLARAMPDRVSGISRKLLANFLINMATYAATKEETFGREALTRVMVAAAAGMEHELSQTAMSA